MLKKCCDALEQKQLKIAFIESASSGYLCSQFSIYKNSGADILLGGLVCYDPSIKVSILGISTKLIKQYSAESMPVTHALAFAGQSLFQNAALIVACTGLLKPGGSAKTDKPEGTFFIAISYLNQIYEYRYFIDGSPLQRLDQLTEQVASEILKIVSA